MPVVKNDDEEEAQKLLERFSRNEFQQGLQFGTEESPPVRVEIFKSVKHGFMTCHCPVQCREVDMCQFFEDGGIFFAPAPVVPDEDVLPQPLEGLIMHENELFVIDGEDAVSFGNKVIFHVPRSEIGADAV